MDQQIWVDLCRDHDLFINYFIHWPCETPCKNYELQEVHLPSYRNVLGSPSDCHHFHMYIISFCINLVKWWLDHYLCRSMKKLIQTELLTKATNVTVLLPKQIFKKDKMCQLHHSSVLVFRPLTLAGKPSFSTFSMPILIKNWCFQQTIVKVCYICNMCLWIERNFFKEDLLK